MANYKPYANLAFVSYQSGDYCPRDDVVFLELDQNLATTTTSLFKIGTNSVYSVPVGKKWVCTGFRLWSSNVGGNVKFWDAPTSNSITSAQQLMQWRYRATSASNYTASTHFEVTAEQFCVVSFDTANTYYIVAAGYEVEV